MVLAASESNAGQAKRVWGIDSGFGAGLELAQPTSVVAQRSIVKGLSSESAEGDKVGAFHRRIASYRRLYMPKSVRASTTRAGTTPKDSNDKRTSTAPRSASAQNKAKPRTKTTSVAQRPKQKATARSTDRSDVVTKSKASTDEEAKVIRLTPIELATAQLQCRETFSRVEALHPDAHCELDFKSNFQLLVSVVLSAQTTDQLVNRVTPALFEKYPDAQAMAAANADDVASLIARIGMFRQKAKNIVGLSKVLIDKHAGEVPNNMAELVVLPGVGRKTANVVLGVAFSNPDGVVVDTHVQRVSQRLGWTAHNDPKKVEKDLVNHFDRSTWDRISHVLIFHGRRVCLAVSPQCGQCGVSERCPSAGRAAKIGRKPKKKRKPTPESTAAIPQGSTVPAKSKNAATPKKKPLAKQRSK